MTGWAEGGEGATRTGTRWGRTTIAFCAGLLAAAALGAGLATGALAAGVTVQNGSGTLATSSLYGTDFGLVIAPETYETPAGSTATRRVMRLAFADGRINGLCIAQPATVGGIAFTLLIKASDGNAGTWEIKADHILLDLTSAAGTLNLDGVVGSGYSNPEVQIGADSSRIAVTGVAPADLGGGAGAWGIKAGIAKFGPVTATIQDLDIQGLLTLPNLSISIAAAGTSCPAPATPVGAPS